MILSRGELADGRSYWAYAAILPSRYKALKEAEGTGDYDLGDYGDVLFWGYGAEPAEEAKEKMEELFLVNQQFEEELTEKFSGFMKDRDKGFADRVVARRLIG